MIEGTPRDVRDPGECVFYHTVDLPRWGVQPGDWDLRGRFDDYVAGTPLSGRSVLDVGTANGFLTFEAEKRGARVTSFDAESVNAFRHLPIREAEHLADPESWRARNGAFLDGMKNGYWLCHRDFESRAHCFYGDIYDLNASIGTFDVVLLGQILVHLPDGISALEAAASVCRETIIITEGSWEDDSPWAGLAGRASKPTIAYAWYQYSTGWYREVLTMLGFSEIEFAKSSYICNSSDHTPRIELTTVVAQRAA